MLIRHCVSALLCVSFLHGQDAADEAIRERSITEQKLMVPMRDGIGLATDVYRPKGTEKVPTIFWRTPYNFNTLRDFQKSFIVSALTRGFAFVIQNERGKYFSQGHWEILGRPRTDGYDALSWITEQPWSNGKVGTLGCSSSAEWQLALASMNHPAHAAMIPMASGAGIGRVGPFMEQGNWYRGGVFQMLFGTWLYSVQNTQRPQFKSDLSREDLVRLSKYFDLAPQMPEVDWPTALYHLPLQELISHLDGPKGIYGDFIKRKPNDPAWFQGGLYHDHEAFEVPSLWMNSWYDVSIGPNLALYQHVIDHAPDPEVASNQFLIIAPTPHCGFFRTKVPTIVGERHLGDARLDYEDLVFGWFDYWLRDRANGFIQATPKVQYYTMGLNQWQQSDQWPPPTEPMTLFLHSDGSANSLHGNGRLNVNKPQQEGADHFVYDPLNPVLSLGGGVCCIGGAVTPGAFDQRTIEARQDVLVYSTEPLTSDLEVTGTIATTLYVSSDAPDTDFTVKLIDVAPDGTAYNIDETIQRARYREGYEKEVFMEKGQVYRIDLSPMTTSNLFKSGHRIRIEVSSSNFPRFARNLNTGGPNYNETKSRTATNSIHHAPQHASHLVLQTVVADGRRGQ